MLDSAELNSGVSNLDSNWDVVIVGAGPAGAAAACSIAADGLRVLLVDAKPFPRRKVCGGCLNQVSTQLVRQLLGAEHPLWQSSVSLDHFELSHAGRATRLEMPPGFAVDRALLDQSLVARAVELGVMFADSTVAKLSPAGGQGRAVELSTASGSRVVTAQVVVLACGLGNRAAGDNQELQHTVARTSRVGVEAIFEKFPKQYAAGTIHMVVAGCGYVGLTQISQGRLHVAAAVDRTPLQQFGPGELVQRLLVEAGAPKLYTDQSIAWRGTPPLTSRAKRVADRRVFVVGDAAGYVEPFTGEGIRWALQSGIGVAPLVVRAVAAWDDHFIIQWEHWYGTQIGRRQRMCRRISTALKSTTARWLADRALRWRPNLAAPIIAHLNSH